MLNLSMDTALKTAKNVKVDSEIFKKFTNDFNTTIEEEIKNNPDAWDGVTMTIGTLDKEIRQAEKDQYITIQITDINDQDGGYIHVYGWSEVNDINGYEEEIEEAYNEVLRQIRRVNQILFMSDYVKDEDKIRSHIKQYYKMTADLDDAYENAINDTIVYYRQLLKNQL